MKKIVALMMVSFVVASMFSVITLKVRAETDFSRPSLPEGPAHTNELVNVIEANTTRVLIVTDGWGPLTGVSPITEKDFWIGVLSEMAGDFDVDWFDGTPTFEQLKDYDLVIYDAGGYWYPLSHVAAPLREYHFSGKPLIVVTPDINYDWQVNGEPVPSFTRDVLHVQGVLGIMPEAVYDIYADTGHEIVYGIPKDVGIGIPAVTSWPDCFDPKADCGKVLRQGYIPETEFGVGTCSGLPSYSPYDPAGKLFAVVAYAGSDTEGRVVTYGFPISGLMSAKIAKQLAQSTIEWALGKALLKIDLTLYIEDAIKGKDETAAPIANKAPGDKIDIVANVLNKEEGIYNIDVVFEVPSDLSLDRGFTRNDFCDIDEKPITPKVDDNKYTVTISLESGRSVQVVLRFDISESALTTICPLVFARTIVEGAVCSSAITMYNMVDNTKAIIVTNRYSLFKKYGFRERAITWALDWADGPPYPPESYLPEYRDVLYKEYCLAFAQDAYQFGADATIQRYGSAKLAWQALSPLKQGIPPRGAYVFYDVTSGKYAEYDHVGLSLGGGSIVHAHWTKGPEIAQYDKIGLQYIGWAWPPIPTDEVQELLNYIFKISDWREENCIVYYVDHYDESLKKWDQKIDYKNEDTANKNASKIDDLIEEWADKLAHKTYWGPFLISVNYPYLMIVGGDEIIPFYRLDDSNYYDTEDNHPYNSDDPVLHTIDENYFLSDNPYADTSGDDYDEGKLELSVGRIVGYSAQDMKDFITVGVSRPEDLDVAIVMHDEAVDDAVDALDEKASSVAQSDTWTDDELEHEMEQGFQILYCVCHGEYYEISAVGGGTLEDDELDDVDSTGGISNNRPLTIFDACRVGVVTDEDEDQWIPEWDDCMVYSLVHRGCSGIVAAGGLAISDYGVKLTNDFISRLIINDQESLPFGTALRDAKVHYDKGLFWSGGEKKTVTEFIYYGVPWSTIDPQGTSTESTSSVFINISNPFYVSNENYAREIEINATDFVISKVTGFDLIEINGAQQALDEQRPVIPTVEIMLSLPLDSNVVDITLMDDVRTLIGFYNIPSFISAEKPEESIFAPSAGLGFYPSPIYSTEIITSYHQKLAKIRVALVQYNPETKETIFYNYTKLQVTYQTAIPLTILELVLEKKEYASSESLNGLVIIESVTSEAFLGLHVNLVLKDCHGQIVASAFSALFDLDSGEIEEISVLLDQELPHGTYLLEAEVTGSGTLATSSTYIKILSGEIVDFYAPDAVKAGDDITFEVSFMNAKSVDVAGESVIYLYDPHNIEIAALYSSPMAFPAGSITQTQITWSTAGKEHGTYIASAMVYAGGESFGPAYHTFEIKPPDEIPPSTTLTVGEPKHVDPMNNIYISSITPFTLTAEDNPGGTGVASTFYRIYNASAYDTGWLEYFAPFYLTGLSDGNYSIDYYSTDNIGNTEPTNTATVILDNTPPTTTLTIGEPKYISDTTYATPDTPFTLEATDTGSGIYSTAYRIYNATYDGDWQTYTAPFKLTSLTDGTYTIEYNSTDSVKNVETTYTASVTLFHWNYIYQDTYGRGTTLKINVVYKFFQFVRPNKDYGIRKATYMKQCGRAIIIEHCDKQLRLITVSVDTKIDFCAAIAWDMQTRKQYFLIDKAGTE